MKIKTILVISALSSLSAMSEEIDYKDVSAPNTISKQIRLAVIAGIGEFVDPPIPTEGQHVTVKLRVSEYWIGDTGTNEIFVSQVIGKNPGFPTGTPVVFFAMKEPPQRTRRMPGKPIVTNTVAEVKYVFDKGDRAWFRTTRDNGLLYVYTTNLWDCIRVNPNEEKYYEVLRSGYAVPSQQSWRINMDSYSSLRDLMRSVSKADLIKMYNDPLLSTTMKETVGEQLRDRFGWWYDENDVIHPPSETPGSEPGTRKKAT